MKKYFNRSRNFRVSSVLYLSYIIKMKAKFRILSFLAIYGLIFSFGCQKELTEIIEPLSEDVLTINSVVSELSKKTTLRDGSYDNIIDNSSCISVKLPVTVIISDQKIIIGSEDDFTLIEELPEYEFEDLSFLFPITIIQADYSELTINDEDELEDIVDDCLENGEDDDIECVDFQYPLSFSVYNTNNQNADVITFWDDKEMHDFLEDIEESDLVSIDFPITLILSDGSTVEATGYYELENIIENAKDECEEDDSHYYDDDPGTSDLAAVLVEGTWYISYFFDETDETSSFTGYEFTFSADGTSLADNGSDQFIGSWQITSEDDGSLELLLNYGESSPFDELGEDWDVFEFDELIIKLMDEDTIEGSKAFLYFEKL